MVGHTLADIRRRLDELSVAVGPYRVVSAKTGNSPVPVSGLRFPTRATAAEAASVATAYRAELRGYDPAVRVEDLIVTDYGMGPTDRDESEPDLPEYCHAITAPLFETLSRRHRAAERAVMDRYLDAAETTDDRDRLCVLLVETAAHVLDAYLAPAEQVGVLSSVAETLPAPTTEAEPLRATLDSLEASGLVDTSHLTTAAAGADQRQVTLRGYRLSGRDGACIVVPVVVELLRRQSAAPQLRRAERVTDGWRLWLSLAGSGPREGVAVVTADG